MILGYEVLEKNKMNKMIGILIEFGFVYCYFERDIVNESARHSIKYLAGN